MPTKIKDLTQIANFDRDIDFVVNDVDGGNKDRRITGSQIKDYSIRTEVGTYTATIDDEVILCNGTFTVTLPPISGITGKRFFIKNIGTGIITIDGDSAETIDGSTTKIITTQYDSLTLVADNTGWYII